MNVSLAIVTAKEVSLTHAFGSKQAFTDGELIDVTVLNRCPCPMSYKLEDKGDLLVGVLWSFELRLR